VDVEKYLLDKVLGLSFISENSLANIPDGTRIASKEQGKCVAITSAYPCQQQLVGGLRRFRNFA